MRLILLFAAFVILGLALESAGARIISFRALIPNLIIILAVDLGLQQRRPQFLQRLAAPHRRQQQAIGLQDMADLQQASRQIIDPVQRQRRDHKIDRMCGKGQHFLVADHPSGTRGKGIGQIGTYHPRRMPGLFQEAREFAIAAAKFQHDRKTALDVVQSIHQPQPRLMHKEAAFARQGRGAMAMATHGGAVEDHDIAGHGPEYV